MIIHSFQIAVNKLEKRAPGVKTATQSKIEQNAKFSEKSKNNSKQKFKIIFLKFFLKKKIKEQ